MVAFADRLKEVRARGARIRSEAFVDYSPVVCGLTLNPVTLASYNRLIAFDSAFTSGGPVSLEAVLGWVWVHHPDFGAHATKAKRKVYRKVWRSLNPRFPHWNAFLHLVSVFPRWRWVARFCQPTAQDRFTEASAHIRHLMSEAMAGFPGPETDRHDVEEDDDGPKLSRKRGYEASPAIAFQAQILNTFRRTYGMSYAETESIPLKRLAQLWREHLFVTLGDKTGLKMMDPEEAALWREELKEDPTHG